MRKWLIGLVVVGGIGIASYLFSRAKRKAKLKNHHEALEYAETFLRATAFCVITQMTNEVVLYPEVGAWADYYDGKIGEETFSFAVLVVAQSPPDILGKDRSYMLQWREVLIQAMLPGDVAREEPHVLERIHERLKIIHQEMDTTQPS